MFEIFKNTDSIQKHGHNDNDGKGLKMRTWFNMNLKSGGGGHRALAVVGGLLALVALVALVSFLGSSTSNAQVVTEITIEKVSGKEATYVARDNLVAPPGKSQTWHYLILSPYDPDCEGSWSQSNAAAYTEGSEIVVSNVGGARINLCFRSVTPSQIGDSTITLYEGLSIRDNTGPAVNKFYFYTGAGNPDNHPVTFNASHIGVAERSFFIEFDEDVTINENGGDGPRLKLNVGEDRYVYLGGGQTNRGRLVFYFTYSPQTGDNTADLDVIGFELNGATMADGFGNEFVPSDHASFFNGYIAANQAIVVDTAAPEINNYTSNPPSTRNAGNIGETIDINVEFKEKVEVDYNGGTGPRLKLNVGNNRYAYIEEATFLRARQVWQFDMFVMAGDNAADLDVIGWENNGATVTDEAGNPFQAGSTANSPFFNGAFADKFAIVIDTVVPTVSVSPSSNDATRKRSITVRASSTAADLDTTSWKHKNITGSAACNAAALSLFSSNGAQMTLDNEAYNGNKVCFAVKDTAANWAYTASGLITGIDRTPPAISVSPSTADAIHKREITVSASSTASDINDNSWRYKVIPQATACNAAAVASQTSSGLDAILNSESHNGRKVCFAAKDTVNNWNYAASGVITGIDRTAPVISVSQVSPDNQVGAIVSDNVDNSPTLQSQIISSNTCGPATTGSFTFYTPGTELTLPVGSRACFRATDSVNNIGYAASGVGVDTTVLADSTPPTITVNPSAADSSPKRQISVTASSSDGDVDAGSWKHKIITASTACNAAAVASSTTAGASTTLNSESQNGHKVCFAVKDTSENWNYAASGVVSGIDRTAPSIAVSSVTNNRVHALVSDIADSSPTFESQIISGSVCNSFTGGSFSPYTASTDLTLSAGQRACFRATDSASNVAYAVSAAGVAPDIQVPANDDTANLDDNLVPPTINIRSVSNTRVSASLTGDLTNSPVLEVQIISDNVCSDNTGGTFEAYVSGTTLTLPIGSRACFKVTDNTGYEDYAVSAAGRKSTKKKKTTTTTPTQTPPEQRELLEVYVTTRDTLSATDSYKSGSTTMYYRIQSDDACDSAHEGAFNGYQEGTELAPNVSSDYYVCFKSVDNDDSDNVAYSISALIVVEIEDPGQPADDPVDGDDDNEGETAIDPLPAPSTPDPGSDVEPDPSSSSDGSRAEADTGGPTDSDPSSAPESDSNRGDLLLALVVIGLPSLALVVVLIRRFFWQKN